MPAPETNPSTSLLHRRRRRRRPGVPRPAVACLALALAVASFSLCRAWAPAPPFAARSPFSSRLGLQKGWLADDGEDSSDANNNKAPKLSAKKVTKREMMQQMKKLQKQASSSTSPPSPESPADPEEEELLGADGDLSVVDGADGASRNTTAAETIAAEAPAASSPKKRKKHKTSQYKSYEPNDNRDALPFAVQEITPDPYTKAAMKKQRRKQQQTNPNNNKKKQKKSPKKQELEDPAELMTSRLKLFPGASGDDQNPNAATLLGEFALDQSTTSGDIICLETTASEGAGSALPRPKYYKVEKARCQYKYAGGKKFVMVRKILEVKEITRALQEKQLEEQFQQASAGGIPPEEA